MALPATDSFTGTNGTLLTVYSPTNWGAIKNNMVINTNAAAPGSFFDRCACAWIADTFNNDQYSQAVLSAIDASGTVSAGVCARGTGSNYYAFTVTTGARELLAFVAGSPTVLASDTVTCSVSDVLKLVCAGTTITAYINGVSVFSVTDSNLTSGSAGVASVGHFSGSVASRVDNWEGGNGTGASGTTYTDTGSATDISVGSGADVAILNDAGSATSVLVGSGVSALTSADAGSAALIAVGSGAELAQYNDSASAASILTGSGADAAVYSDAASAVAALFGGGADVLVMVDAGGGVLVAVGSGADDGPTPPIDLPFQGDAYLYDSAGGTGSIAGGTVLANGAQPSAIGSVSGATVLPGPSQGSATGSIAGGTVLPPETIL